MSGEKCKDPTWRNPWSSGLPWKGEHERREFIKAMAIAMVAADMYTGIKVGGYPLEIMIQKIEEHYNG